MLSQQVIVLGAWAAVDSSSDISPAVSCAAGIAQAEIKAAPLAVPASDRNCRLLKPLLFIPHSPLNGMALTTTVLW